MYRIMIRLTLSLIFTFIQFFLFAQSGIVKGRVFNGINNESISFARIKVIGLPKGAITDDMPITALAWRPVSQ